MRKTAATVLALLIYMSAPAFSAGPPPTDDEPAELTDVAPYRCANDVPEADVVMVDMACEDDAVPEAMSTALTTNPFCCSQCWRYPNYLACLNNCNHAC